MWTSTCHDYLILKAFYTRTYHNIWAGSANWSYFMWLGFLFILNCLFVCLFVCSFLIFIFFGYFFKCVTIQIWDQTCQKLLPAVEVTSKRGWRDNKPISSCIMFIIVYSSFIFELWIFCIYWIYVLNLCIYYFWIYVFFFEFMYLLF